MRPSPSQRVCHGRGCRARHRRKSFTHATIAGTRRDKRLARNGQSTRRADPAARCSFVRSHANLVKPASRSRAQPAVRAVHTGRIYCLCVRKLPRTPDDRSVDGNPLRQPGADAGLISGTHAMKFRQLLVSMIGFGAGLRRARMRSTNACATSSIACCGAATASPPGTRAGRTSATRMAAALRYQSLENGTADGVRCRGGAVLFLFMVRT